MAAHIVERMGLIVLGLITQVTQAVQAAVGHSMAGIIMVAVLPKKVV